jgi:hypothetical protein
VPLIRCGQSDHNLTPSGHPHPALEARWSHEGLYQGAPESHWLLWDLIHYCHDPPEELGTLGQQLQPGHTLTPMAIQGGDCSPSL